MWSRRPSASRPPRQGGFTLVELMIGVVIGLLASLAVTHVLVNSEGQKRTTTSASDAQINGALALNVLQRALQPAGYGFGALRSVVGCTLTATLPSATSAATVASFPRNLVPVTITQGTDSDTIRVLASGKTSYSIPLRVISPGYAPSDPLRNQKFPVATVRSVAGPRLDSGGAVIESGDIMVAAVSASTPCEMFLVTANSGTAPEVARGDAAAGWNTLGFPTGTYNEGSFLLNMGAPVDVTYAVTNNALTARTLRIATSLTAVPSYDGPVEIFPNIVSLQAFYGKDLTNNGSVDRWDTVTPTTNAEWLQVVAVRVALVARSTQYEKEEVTFGPIRWDVGLAGTFPAAATCGSSRCVNIGLSHLAPSGSPDERKHYRYRIFEAVIPLRNMLWN